VKDESQGMSIRRARREAHCEKVLLRGRGNELMAKFVKKEFRESKKLVGTNRRPSSDLYLCSKCSMHRSTRSHFYGIDLT
jgi:hypothetical protein